MALLADNVAGASPTPAPAYRLGLRSPNVPAASEDNPTVTLNYSAEYLQVGSAEGPACSASAATAEKRGALWDCSLNSLLLFCLLQNTSCFLV